MRLNTCAQVQLCAHMQTHTTHTNDFYQLNGSFTYNLCIAITNGQTYNKNHTFCFAFALITLYQLLLDILFTNLARCYKIDR